MGLAATLDFAVQDRRWDPLFVGEHRAEQGASAVPFLVPEGEGEPQPLPVGGHYPSQTISTLLELQVVAVGPQSVFVVLVVAVLTPSLFVASVQEPQNVAIPESVELSASAVHSFRSGSIASLVCAYRKRFLMALEEDTISVVEQVLAVVQE